MWIIIKKNADNLIYLNKEKSIKYLLEMSFIHENK